jgi:hypothetical protein
MIAVAYADFDSGLSAFNAGDYQTAWRELFLLAERGDARAYLFVGYMLQEGLGTEQNATEATRWYRKAIDARMEGYAPIAQNNLGLMYLSGEGVPQDYAQGFELLRQAAMQDYFQAQSNLAWYLQQGEGIERDLVEALAWYVLASVNGDVTRFRNLSELKQELSAEQLAAGLVRAAELAREIAAEAAAARARAAGSTGSATNPLGAPLTDRFSGTFADDELKIELRGENGRYSGQITFGEEVFPLTATSEGDKLNGSFEAAGNRFDFTATREGDILTFVTGGKTYLLTKRAVNPLG